MFVLITIMITFCCEAEHGIRILFHSFISDQLLLLRWSVFGVRVSSLDGSFYFKFIAECSLFILCYMLQSNKI